MKSKKLHKLKVIKRIFLFTLALVLTNCQDSENLTAQEQSNIKTVSINDAKAFLTKSTNNPTSKISGSEIGGLDFDKATLEKLSGSDQLLTVIPFATNNEVRNDRVLIVKIDNEIRSVILSMQPDENSTQDRFSGKVFIYSLEGDFITGYGAKDGIYIGQYLKEKSNSKTSKNPQDGEGGVLIIYYYKKPVNAVNATDFDAIWGSGGSSMGWEPVGGGSGVTWDATSGGGSGSASTPTVVVLPPSCESFNFSSKKGTNWQEALVKNVNFKVVLLTPPNHIEITHVISYPPAISFGMPINFNKGNVDVTPGVAATVSAMVLQLAMDKTVTKYGKTDASELTVSLYFQEQLINEYREYTNGGKVNFNSTSNIKATEYKTKTLGTGNCD